MDVLIVKKNLKYYRYPMEKGGKMETCYYKELLDFNAQLPTNVLDWFEQNYDKIYTYNGQIQEELIKTLEANGVIFKDNEKKNLSRFVYVARCRLSDRREKLHKEKMLSEDWLPLNNEIVKKAFAEKKRIEINGIYHGNFFDTAVKEIFKPYINYEGRCFLMKPRASKKGLPISAINDAFCKII